jgi:lipid II:glycine glycyltransferase (peptidoglycan interpeptide bridge formation enzyme)
VTGLGDLHDGGPAMTGHPGEIRDPAGLGDLHDATDEELRTWDRRAVEAPGGHILQSLAWGEHRARTGSRIRHLVFGDGMPLLVLERSWPLVGGASAYLSRGPVPCEPPELTARRVEAAATWLASRGVDVVAADPEVPEASAYGELIRRAGWHPIEELWQSKHRMTRPIDDGEDEAAAFGAIAKTTRQRIRAAERSGIRIVRLDPAAEAAALERAPWPGEGFVGSTEPLPAMLERFYGWLVATGERRGFEVGTPAEHVAWWRAAAEAGHLVYLEARTPDDGPVAGLVLYRHGDRLSTASSADRAELRRAHPGALHLLRWRALQLTIREGRRELDMGGVDVPGAREEPREGDPMFGLYQHKGAFGARWLALSGAHEKVARPRRYAAGRALARADRLLGGRR